MDLNPDTTNATFNFILQVWRPSPTVNVTGCYNLVDDFLSALISVALQPVSKRVARVTPSLKDQLQFQPGDVLGFYVESHGSPHNSDYDNGVVLLNNGSHTSELVWFASADVTAQTSQSGSCPYPVGITGILNSSAHAAPVISVSVITTPCQRHHTLFTTTSYSSSTNLASTEIYSYQVYPTSTSANLVPTETYSMTYKDDPFSSSTTLVVGISVTVFVVVILSTIVAMTVLYCVKCHRKGIPTSTNDGDGHDSELYTQIEHNYDYPNVDTMASMELKDNQAYGKLNSTHGTLILMEKTTLLCSSQCGIT